MGGEAVEFGSSRGGKRPPASSPEIERLGAAEPGRREGDGAGRRAPARAGAIVPASQPAAGGSLAARLAADVLRVLLVDDDDLVLEFLNDAFTTDGCFVSTCSTAERALDLLVDHPYDLVVCDIKMPGLSGLDLLRAVKGKQPGIPVVLITGLPSVNSAIFGLRHGAYDYLLKPFSYKDILQLIQRLRRDRQVGGEQLSYPAGVMEELDRRRNGVEGLFRIGELALQDLDPTVFMESVLDYTVQSLRGDAALILLRDDDGTFTQSQRGNPLLVTQLLNLLRSSFEDLVKSGGKEPFALAGHDYPVAALAVVIPGAGDAAGVLCLGRDAESGAFLPDEKEFLLGYAQTIALAVQKILFRENLETHLIETIAFFITALESKDPDLKGHSARVSMYAAEIATALGLPPGDVAVARRAGILHDLGKLMILDSILLKPDRLTQDEYALVMRHPLTADRILRPLRFLADEARAVRHHLERYDGTGQPDGLKGSEIPLIARIIMVADSFDAMTSNRPYRSALPLEVALSEILRGANTQFDPAVTEALASIPRARLAEIGRYYGPTARP